MALEFSVRFHSDAACVIKTFTGILVLNELNALTVIS